MSWAGQGWGRSHSGATWFARSNLNSHVRDAVCILDQPAAASTSPPPAFHAQEEQLHNSKQPMSWVSHEMMRERTCGPYQNYGEMLYAESLEGLMLRRQKVSAGQRGLWRGHGGDERCLPFRVGNVSGARHRGVFTIAVPFFMPHSCCAPAAPPKAERQRAERYAEEMSMTTFTPEITKMAQQMWSRHELAGVPAWQRLSQGEETRTSATACDSLERGQTGTYLLTPSITTFK
jgi:hypothetical protein